MTKSSTTIGKKSRFDSVSESCFIVRSGSNIDKVSPIDSSADLFPSLFPKEDPSFRAKRLSLFNQYSNELDGIKLNGSVHEKALTELSNFIISSSGASSAPYKELPTALLMIGMGGVDDSSTLFEEVKNRIRNDEHFLGSMAYITECKQLKKVLSSMIQQLICETVEDAEENEESPDFDYNRILSYDLNLLHSYYELNSVGDYPLVVMLPEVETCDAGVLRDFISILSANLDRLPFVLVLGMGTGLETFNQMLPKSLIGRLKLQAFRFEQPKASIESLTKELFLKRTNGPFVSSKTLKLIFDNFYLHDLSITSFVRSVKYSLMETFFGNPLSILCVSDDKLDFSDLSQEHLELIRSLESFKSFVEELLKDDDKGEIVRELLINDHSLRQRIPDFVREIRSFRSGFDIAFETLLQIQESFISSASLKKPLTELLCLFFQPNSEVGLEFIESVVLKLVRLLKRDSVNALATKLLQTWWSSEYDSHAEFLDKLTELISQHSAAEAETRATKGEESHKVLARELSVLLSAFFRKFLLRTDCPMLPLYEVFYPDSSRSLFKAFHAQPRSTIHSALTRPHFYLNCDCCSGSQKSFGTVHCSLPDTCIVYMLYLETGSRYINLHDWFMAFGCILEQRGDELLASQNAARRSRSKAKRTADLEKDKNEEKKNQILARFMASINELSLMGYISPCSRKRDHVIRMTFESASL